MEERKSVLESTKPADALGTLSSRVKLSRTAVVIIAVAGVIAGALVIGLIWSWAGHGVKNAPYIPQVAI